MSWWLSKYVQKRLDEPVRYGDQSKRKGLAARISISANDASFENINGWRAQ